MANSFFNTARQKTSFFLGLALLLMLLTGAAVGLYLTKVNQDLRQQAAETTYACTRASRVSSSTNSSSITISQAMMDACEDACPNAHLYVARYKCSGVGLNQGCQDNGEIVSNDAQVGQTFSAASASCGTTQIDVGCKSSANTWGNVAFASKTFANACGGGPTPTPTPTRRVTPTPTPTPTTRITLTPTPTPTGTLTPTPTPTPTGVVGPQCLEIQMFDVSSGTATAVSGDDDENFVPGETIVRFVCGNTQGEPLPSGYSYRFRIYEPCSGTSSTVQELDADSGGSGVNFDLELPGDYAAQCAVCPDGGTTNDCDWEAYTHSCS